MLVPYQGKLGNFVNPWKREWKLWYQLTLGQNYASLEVSLALAFKWRIEQSSNMTTILFTIVPVPKLIENNIGETPRRISERVKDHTNKDVHLHLIKHAVKSGHEVLHVNNYNIIGKGYQNNNRKRKIAEALLIKEIRNTE